LIAIEAGEAPEQGGQHLGLGRNVAADLHQALAELAGDHRLLAPLFALHHQQLLGQLPAEFVVDPLDECRCHHG
jgi:hypothetical protein